MPQKRSETKHTSLQISIQADLLTVILAAYSPSEPTTQIPTVNLKLCMTIPNIQIQSFPTAMQTVRPSHEQCRPPQAAEGTLSSFLFAFQTVIQKLFLILHGLPDRYTWTLTS